MINLAESVDVIGGYKELFEPSKKIVLQLIETVYEEIKQRYETETKIIWIGTEDRKIVYPLNVEKNDLEYLISLILKKQELLVTLRNFAGLELLLWKFFVLSFFNKYAR